MQKSSLAVAFIVVVSLSGCWYGDLRANDAEIGASRAEMLNQYRRRAELVPDLVQTAAAYGVRETDVLAQAMQACARADALPATPETFDDPVALARFQAAQEALSGALARLLAIAEHYPRLQSDIAFRDLQSQLGNTEKRILDARARHAASVAAYRAAMRSMPGRLTALAFGFPPRAGAAGVGAAPNAGPVRMRTVAATAQDK